MAAVCRVKTIAYPKDSLLFRTLGGLVLGPLVTLV